MKARKDLASFSVRFRVMTKIPSGFKRLAAFATRFSGGRLFWMIRAKMLPQRHPSFERKIAFVARVLRVKLTYVSFELVRIFETFVAKSARIVVTSRVFGKVRAKKMILVKTLINVDVKSNSI